MTFLWMSKCGIQYRLRDDMFITERRPCVQNDLHTTSRGRYFNDRRRAYIRVFMVRCIPIIVTEGTVLSFDTKDLSNPRMHRCILHTPLGIPKNTTTPSIIVLPWDLSSTHPGVVCIFARLTLASLIVLDE